MDDHGSSSYDQLTPAGRAIVEKMQQDKRRELLRQAHIKQTGRKPGRVGRNQPCPCGSGLKYKKCHGRARQVSHFAPRPKILNQPRPTMPPAEIIDLGKADAQSPEAITETTVAAMETIGVDPAVIHAYKATGLLLTDFNAQDYPEEDIKQWNAAIEEYRNEHAEPKGDAARDRET